MPDMHFYEPSSGHRLPHCPLKAIVAPRLIGWISTVDEGGQRQPCSLQFFPPRVRVTPDSVLRQ